jgi:hypothetical protein
VDKENLNRLKEINEDVVTVECDDLWKIDPLQLLYKKRLKEIAEKVAPASVQLKRGAQVMLLRNRVNDVIRYNKKLEKLGDDFISNIKRPLVNGSRGIVVGFVASKKDESELIPMVRFDDGQLLAVGKIEHEIHSPDGKGLLIRNQVPLKLAWYSYFINDYS